MRPDKWRARAERLISLAQRAREVGDLRWAEHLTARAEQCLSKANAMAASAPLHDDGDSCLDDTDLDDADKAFGD